MNKQYFQNMFSSEKGKVYKLVSDLSPDTATVTEQFISDSGTDSYSIVVVHLVDCCVVYSDMPMTITSEHFEEIADLTPDVITVDAIVEEIPANDSGVV